MFEEEKKWGHYKMSKVNELGEIRCPHIYERQDYCGNCQFCLKDANYAEEYYCVKYWKRIWPTFEACEDFESDGSGDTYNGQRIIEPGVRILKREERKGGC